MAPREYADRFYRDSHPSERFNAGHDDELAELELRLAAYEWRPIETAPTDGTTVDLWCEDENGTAAKRKPDCRWGSMTNALGDEFEGWIGLYQTFHGWAPTHWRLPPLGPSEVED